MDSNPFISFGTRAPERRERAKPGDIVRFRSSENLPTRPVDADELKVYQSIKIFLIWPHHHETAVETYIQRISPVTVDSAAAFSPGATSGRRETDAEPASTRSHEPNVVTSVGVPPIGTRRPTSNRVSFGEPVESHSGSRSNLVQGLVSAGNATGTAGNTTAATGVRLCRLWLDSVGREFDGRRRETPVESRPSRRESGRTADPREFGPRRQERRSGATDRRRRESRRLGESSPVVDGSTANPGRTVDSARAEPPVSGGVGRLTTPHSGFDTFWAEPLARCVPSPNFRTSITYTYLPFPRDRSRNSISGDTPPPLRFGWNGERVGEGRGFLERERLCNTR